MSERRTFSVAVFARNQGKVLLIKHKRLGLWLPPGGEVQEGETPLEAARRELLEETGLQGRFTYRGGVDTTPPGFIGYEEHPAGEKGLHLNFAFVADVATREVKPNHEFDQFVWVADAGHLDCPRNVWELARLSLHAGESPLVALGRAWLRAFNARDLESLLALYAEEAIHTSPKLRAQKPKTKGEIHGKPALRAWWAEAMERFPGLRYEERSITANENRIVLEYERINPGEPSYRVAETLVCEAGIIVASHVYHG